MTPDTIIGLVEFILALIALIIIHEFGHFIACRLLGIEVEEFGIGFPPRILNLFKAWDTQFTLNWIPLGGFVRPKGDNDPNVEGGLAAASPWKRLVVFFAGPVMNLLVGVILYTIIIARVGVQDTTRVEIYSIVPNSPAQSAGLQPGDIIVQINDTKINSYTVLQTAVQANLGKPVTLTVQRAGELKQVSVVPRVNPPAGEGAIGIGMTYPTIPVSWYEAVPQGGVAVYNHALTLLELPVLLAQGKVSPDQGRLVGFKGMYDIYQTARTETTPGVPAGVEILFFFASITISLGMFNLVPFPALDGGRILFVLPELVLRRRIPTEYENLINLVGFAVLLLLLIFINVQDFVNPLNIPK